MKKELRKKYLLVRKNISDKLEKDKIILKKILNNKMVRKTKIILCYVSYNDEIDTLDLINELLKSKIVAVPKIENNEMNFYIISSINELKEGYFKILEPDNNNLLTNFNELVSITPGICFDKLGYRIGYGKGFYDKFYSEHSNIYKIGLCYKECMVDKIKKDKFDINVDEIITD